MLRKVTKRTLKKIQTNNYETLNRIELSRQNVLDNLAFIGKQNPNQHIIPVLKGNAYGHGIIQIAEILNDADVPFLAVDGYFEAAQIRDTTKHRILVMGYIKPGNASMLDIKRCSFVVQDTDMLHAFGKLKKSVRIHVELNTGMHRLGLQLRELDEYLSVVRSYPNLQLEGVMTHLADADNPVSPDFVNEQVQTFDRAIDYIKERDFQPQYFHVAQTAGSTKANSKYANAVRLGIGLYGINPLAVTDPEYKKLSGLKPVLELKSTIVKTYELKKGDKVSYNGIFVAPGTMRVGILPFGYYEGLPRELSNRGHATAGSKVLPIRGRICMNHTIVDISASELMVGDEVTLIGRDPSLPNAVSSIAAAHGTFNYGLVTGLAQSVRRVII